MVVIEPEATEEMIIKPPKTTPPSSATTPKSTGETTRRDASDGFETASDAELSDEDADHTQKRPQLQVEEEVVNEDELKQKACEKANEAKSEGNKLFGEGKYEEALSKYELASQVVPEDMPSSVELRAICHSNRGVCFLKLGKYEDTVKECSKALELNPTYMKALVRRGEAHEKLEKYEEAIADMQKILELDPSNYQAKRTANRLKPLAEEKREQMKEEMMGKLKEMGNSLLGRFGMSVDNFKAVKDPNTVGKLGALRRDQWKMRIDLMPDVTGPQDGCVSERLVVNTSLNASPEYLSCRSF